MADGRAWRGAGVARKMDGVPHLEHTGAPPCTPPGPAAPSKPPCRASPASWSNASLRCRAMQAGRSCCAGCWQSARSEEHASELQSLMRISYAVFCLKKKKHTKKLHTSIKENTDTITSK